jgi:hypothetical protein
VDGEPVGAAELSPTLDADANAPLSILGGPVCGNLEGSIALTLAVEGPLSDSDTRALEEFVLARAVAAGL